MMPVKWIIWHPVVAEANDNVRYATEGKRSILDEPRTERADNIFDSANDKISLPIYYSIHMPVQRAIGWDLMIQELKRH